MVHWVPRLCPPDHPAASSARRLLLRLVASGAWLYVKAQALVSDVRRPKCGCRLADQKVICLLAHLEL
jgi:hypothetical protein